MRQFCLLALLTVSIGLMAAEPVVKVKYDSTFTGRGNAAELLFEALICPHEDFILESLELDSKMTFPSDVVALHIMLVNGNDERSLGTYDLECGTFSYELLSPLEISEETLLRVRADISDSAAEGNKVIVRLSAINAAGNNILPVRDEGCCRREILLCRKRLYAPGDYGSRNWRIPALMSLPDGSLLAVNDKRKYNETDLPEDIDIVARRSTDNGRTWTEPVNIAVGQGYKKGFGDPALALTSGGDVICVFVGGNGLWASTPEEPQCSYVSRSSDGGVTWSAPVNITSVLWGANASNPQCRQYSYSFFGSGNGLTLKKGKYAGRVLFAAAMGPAKHLNNHAVYSDDGGVTWNVSDLAFEGGDEAKMVELSDGRILMSVRRTGYRGYCLSDDGGVTWHSQGLWPEMNTNACNGDMIRYPAAAYGGTDMLLHSIPNSMDRRNVSIFCSYDEGKTWCSPKTICPTKSVYSSMTVLNDGTVGIYVEENPEPEDCSLWFMNFSMDWLTADKNE